MDIDLPERLPLLPEALLLRHKVHFPSDTRFRASARLLQALWREKKGLPLGRSVDAAARAAHYGHLLPEPAARAGSNFLSDAVHRLATRELAYREPGALIDDNRVYRNLLASMPLALNLFGHLKANPDLAKNFVEACFPAYRGRVAHIQFEHSPGRGDPRFTDDGTAFDVFVSLRTDDGAKVFLAIEVKYSEGMAEAEPRMRPRYDDLSRTSELYRDPEDPALRRNPFQQLWRQHMLAQSIVDCGLYDGGALVMVAPSLNNEIQKAAIRYQGMLSKTGGRVGFLNKPLEEIIAGVALAGDAEYASALRTRYTDFSPVHALL